MQCNGLRIHIEDSLSRTLILRWRCWVSWCASRRIIQPVEQWRERRRGGPVRAFDRMRSIIRLNCNSIVVSIGTGGRRIGDGGRQRKEFGIGEVRHKCLAFSVRQRVGVDIDVHCHSSESAGTFEMDFHDFPLGRWATSDSGGFGVHVPATRSQRDDTGDNKCVFHNSEF